MKNCFQSPTGKFIFLALITITAFKNTNAQLIAFPGAEGYGKYATGGRGGKVAAVTNLQNDGPGSLRHALAAYPDEPLTVVFQVSGIIELTSPLTLKRSNVTIAGQTAPGDGICLKGHSFIINGAGKGDNKGNIIIRYIRSRPGSTLRTGVYGLDIENCHDIIIDHCSFSWANEECVAAYDVKNITIQWCIVSEGLYEAGHHKGHRSYGGVWGGQYASYHHNLLAHLNSRTVRFSGARAHDTMAIVDYRNNVIYNWGNKNACYGGDIKIPGGVSKVNIVNNYYQPGPATADTLRFVHAQYARNPDNRVGEWFIAGNYMAGNRELTQNNWQGVDLTALPDSSRARAKSDTVFPVMRIMNNQIAKEAYKAVLAGAGATLPKRDSTDIRIIYEVEHKIASGQGSFGKAGIIDSPAAVGGWATYKNGKALPDTDGDGMPDEWELKNELNPKDAFDGNVVNASGYTNLEVYLNSLVASGK
ncbi:pectate lyase [Niastella caeni]|uniref:Pectate lyase n=1 Tax=Niastella caeni TaxID=2569763 RepID=A0A4S8HZX2_9BACT|nr:pectate lyase [Niastella caeni]THU39744.1 pectate lyase [Niastella caeni]